MIFSPDFLQWMQIKCQYLMPKHALTAIAGRFANHKGGALTQYIIKWFIHRYGVDMTQAAQPDVAKYETFNAFFTRALHSTARPIAIATWVCPVDGAISQMGEVHQGQIFQAKRHAYSTLALLGGSSDVAQMFAHGDCHCHFATLYLSPKDYHRIHMPCQGTLRQMLHVPGDLFSVNPATAQNVPQLFARNERVVCLFDTEHGPLAMVLVGATVVGSIATVWHGVVNPNRSIMPSVSEPVGNWHYPNAKDAQAITLAQGEEMGRFLLGSTVVMLWATPKSIQFNPTWQAELPIRLGQVMAIST